MKTKMDVIRASKIIMPNVTLYDYLRLQASDALVKTLVEKGKLDASYVCELTDLLVEDGFDVFLGDRK